MALQQDNPTQFTLPGVEPREPVAAERARAGAPKGRVASAVPRALALDRGEPVRTSVSVLPRLVHPEKPDARGQVTVPGVASADRVESTPRAECIAPECIKPSKYLTRERSYWEGKEFQEFKEDIRNAERNIQPIKVRPVVGEGDIKYEVVFGHRRHRACLDLGLPVSAVVEDLDDLQLFSQMVRENSSRSDCSVYARGLQFMLAIDSKLIHKKQDWRGLFGVDKSMVHKLVKLARLPQEVVQAFDCPSQLRTRWGLELTRVLDNDKDGLFQRVAEVAQWAVPRNPKLVFSHLLNEPQSASVATGEEVRLVKLGRMVATVRIAHAATGDGISVEFSPGAVDSKLLMKTLRQLLKIDEADVSAIL